MTFTFTKRIYFPSTLLSEVHLDFSIYQAYPISHNLPKNIFLTGATGFLGAFLLKDILENYSKSKVYCLVRAKTHAEGRQKVIQNLKKYQIEDEKLSTRIIPVLGDLSISQLGLSSEKFNQLAKELDVIFHSGALVNHAYSYEQHKAANVNGTQEILRLASQAKTKVVHYISTVGVYPAVQNSDKPLLEDDRLEFAGELVGGYSQSKWVAEKIALSARSRGLPINIYRPGRITGHSKTGVWNLDDALSRIIKSCIQLKMMPNIEGRIDFTPVDYVSGTIVHISQQSKNLNQTFNLVNTDYLSLDDLFINIKNFGFTLEKVDYNIWRKTLINTLEAGIKNALHPYLPLINENQIDFITPIYDCTDTLKALKNIDPTWVMDVKKLLPVYFKFLIDSGYLFPLEEDYVIDENNQLVSVD